mmetsp:Transcript_53428/g.88712  ORF Transcript_53428/g.88712 Transcript_53428/m.88712 type:complete len:156 (+) Transcript_53428:159-626(+)
MVEGAGLPQVLKGCCQWCYPAVGSTHDCTAAHIGFAPRYQADAFTCFNIAEGGWGQFEQAATTVIVSAGTKLTVTLGGGSVKDVEPFQTASGVRQRRSDMSSRTATEMPTTSARAVQKKMPKLISQESALLAACGTVLFFLGALCGNALGAHPAS